MSAHHNQPRIRRDWTAEEDAVLNALLADGQTIVEVAESLDRAVSSIKSRITTLADKRAEPPVRSDTRQGRKCLCCGKSFLSEGAHNRMCTACRTKSVSPYELYA